MATALYDTGRAAFLTAGVNWTSDNIKVALVNTSSYTVNLATDQFLNIIPGGAIVATSGNLTSTTATAGVANAANLTYTAVSGSTIGALVIYKDTGVSSTSQLIAYIDNATGLPVTPNGGNITVTWDTGANKIFKL